MKEGRYDSEKIFDMVCNQNISISTIEFKYGIHRNELLELLSEYHIKNKTDYYYNEVQKGDKVSFYYIYEYRSYFIVGRVRKKYMNSILVDRVGGDELPSELLDLIVIPSNAVTIMEKGY